MQTYRVGQSYIPGQVRLGEQIRYRLDIEGHSLLIVKPGVTSQEIDNVQKGAVELGIYIDGPVIFLLFKFGTSNWNDAPFSWHTVPAGIRVYPEEANETGKLKVAFVEATDGIVKAVREVLFEPEFASKINEAITIQANGSFNGLSYGKHINMVYNQYDADAMVEMLIGHMTSSGV